MLLVKGKGGDARHDALLVPFEQYLRERGGSIFLPGRPITVGRAPARIDLMGGIADYSGSVVFEGPLGQAAVVGFQPRPDRLLRVRSALLESQGEPYEVEVPLDELRRGDGPLDCADAHALLTAHGADRWAAYLLGAVPVLEAEGVIRMESGASFLLWSDVPVGVGVASSAALEVAAMFALTSALGARLEALRLAALAQVVENRIVGAPCGIMDQVTSALGEQGKLMALHCQPLGASRGDEPLGASRRDEPCDVLGLHELPAQVGVFGISSRVQHSVGGDAYRAARVSAFMGLKIILTEMQRQGRAITDKDRYLCNISPAAYRAQFRDLLPDTISGADFLKTYGETTDAVTRVDADRTYRVRPGAEHPIFENYRVETFIECIERARAGDRTALVEAGGLMYASHWSYGWNCGLGCEETDLLVSLVRERGPESGLYGAKITGGGSGGTVAILADKSAEPAVRSIAARYEQRTGTRPDIFDSSSPGAYAFGHRVYTLH